MAYTKILVVHNRLDKSVRYVQSGEKTSLETAIDYALNRDKTERTCFETAINCDLERVYADMMDTKRRWGKEGRVRKGYHIIQSFAPGEVTPEEAHAVGVEFAQRLLGETATRPLWAPIWTRPISIRISFLILFPLWMGPCTGTPSRTTTAASGAPRTISAGPTACP